MQPVQYVQWGGTTLYLIAESIPIQYRTKEATSLRI